MLFIFFANHREIPWPRSIRVRPKPSSSLSRMYSKMTCCLERWIDFVSKWHGGVLLWRQLFCVSGTWGNVDGNVAARKQMAGIQLDAHNGGFCVFGVGLLT